MLFIRLFPLGTENDAVSRICFHFIPYANILAGNNFKGLNTITSVLFVLGVPNTRCTLTTSVKQTLTEQFCLKMWKLPHITSAASQSSSRKCNSICTVSRMLLDRMIMLILDKFRAAYNQPVSSR